MNDDVIDEIHVNLMVVEEAEVNARTGLKHYCEPCDTLSEEDARTQWEVNSSPGDRIVAMCRVVLKDETHVRFRDRPYAETYEALMALNRLSEEPRVQDLLTRIFLETQRLPQSLTLDAGGRQLRWDLGAAATYDAAGLSRSARWRADFEPPKDARQRTYLEVWEHLVGLAPEQIAAAATALKVWAGLSDDEATDGAARPVTASELLRLADSPLIEIGGHTRTHADLGGLSRAQAAREIGGGRRDLIEMTGRDVRSFAYPYGRFGPGTIADIRDAGFTCAGWSRSGLATPRSDPHALPRVHATDLSAERFEALLSEFMIPRRRCVTHV